MHAMMKHGSTTDAACCLDELLTCDIDLEQDTDTERSLHSTLGDDGSILLRLVGTEQLR